MTIQRQFFVAMSEEQPGAGYAACVSHDKKIVAAFFRKNAGSEIRKVDGAEMERLLDSYLPQQARAIA